MAITRINDRERIEAFLRGDPYLNLYGLGDLDEPYWAHTVWHAVEDGGEIRAIALLYTGLSLPTLLAFARKNVAEARELVRSLAPELPERFYCHLSPPLAEVLGETCRLESHGDYRKIGLVDPDRLDGFDSDGVVGLGHDDAEGLAAFYDASYPDHWFEPSMLDLGPFYGLRDEEGLASAAGVHVLSRRYRVAVVGNVATRADCRGRGYGAAVTAAVCRDVLPHADHLGTNVRADNAAALRCYEKLGFEVMAPYTEYMAERG